MSHTLGGDPTTIPPKMDTQSSLLELVIVIFELSDSRLDVVISLDGPN